MICQGERRVSREGNQGSEAGGGGQTPEGDGGRIMRKTEENPRERAVRFKKRMEYRTRNESVY